MGAWIERFNCLKVNVDGALESWRSVEKASLVEIRNGKSFVREVWLRDNIGSVLGAVRPWRRLGAHNAPQLRSMLLV